MSRQDGATVDGRLIAKQQTNKQTFTGQAVLTSLADSKFFLIEYSPELMNVNNDELLEKFLFLENVDFELATNGRMVTEMVDHQDKPDDQTKDN